MILQRITGREPLLALFFGGLTLLWPCQAAVAASPRPEPVLDSTELRLVVGGPEAFDFDGDQLKRGGRLYLEAMLDLLPLLDGIDEILLIGHTDAIGTDAYNLGLSRRRAEAVRRLLLARGIDPRRIRIEAAGSHRPRASNAHPAGRAANRRVEVVIRARRWRLRPPATPPPQGLARFGILRP